MYKSKAKLIEGGWNLEVTDSSGDVGAGASAILDNGDNLHICYFDKTNKQLKYAKRNGTSWNIKIVDTYSFLYGVVWSSMAIGSNDNVHICYTGEGSNCLKYAKWNGVSWNIEILDNAQNTGQYCAIVVDSVDMPNIVYYNHSIGALRHIKFNGDNWNIANIETYVSQQISVTYISASLHSDVNIVYAVTDSTIPTTHLKYAKYNGVSWSIETIRSTQYLYRPSLIMDINDYAHICYCYRVGATFFLVYLKWNGVSWESTNVFTSSQTFGGSILGVDSQNVPNIVFYDFLNNSIKYAKSNGLDWDIGIIDSNTSSGSNKNSLVISPTDKPFVVYYDGVNADLKLATEKVGYNYFKSGPLLRTKTYRRTDYPDVITFGCKFKAQNIPEEDKLPSGITSSNVSPLAIYVKDNNVIRNNPNVYLWYDDAEQKFKLRTSNSDFSATNDIEINFDFEWNKFYYYYLTFKLQATDELQKAHLVIKNENGESVCDQLCEIYSFENAIGALQPIEDGSLSMWDGYNEYWGKPVTEGIALYDSGKYDINSYG